MSTGTDQSAVDGVGETEEDRALAAKALAARTRKRRQRERDQARREAAEMAHEHEVHVHNVMTQLRYDLQYGTLDLVDDALIIAGILESIAEPPGRRSQKS